MQLDEVKKLNLLIVEVSKFYRQDATPFTIMVWENAMQPYSFEQVSKALTAHVSNPENGQFMPKPADIVRQLIGTATDRSSLAWGKVFEAIGTVGAYQDVIFEDAAIHAVIEDIGGWSKICRGETKDLSFLMHRFCESYKAYAKQEQFDYPRKLMGDRSPDSEFEKKGIAPPKPYLVGDRATCQAVFDGGSTGGKGRISIGNMTVPLLRAA
jgi:hypothetical protein